MTLPAIFVSQTNTKLVRGRRKYKVPNLYTPATEDPEYQRWIEERLPEKKLTELETLYKEFCEKAYRVLRGHESLQGESHPYRVIFPDFYFDIIPDKFPVE